MRVLGDGTIKACTGLCRTVFIWEFFLIISLLFLPFGWRKRNDKRKKTHVLQSIQC